MNTQVTVLTPHELATRWNVSVQKIYLDNSTGKLPHLKTNRNRFPLVAIEELENEAGFDKTNISTPAERRLKRKVKELEELIELKDKQIEEFKQQIAKAQMLFTKVIYEDMKEVFQV